MQKLQIVLKYAPACTSTDKKLEKKRIFRICKSNSWMCKWIMEQFRNCVFKQIRTDTPWSLNNWDGLTHFTLSENFLQVIG